jgi:acylphosphatase
MNRRQMQVIYSGHVQGVGFRYTVKSLVSGYEITGTIRNLPDGRVELIAEGSQEELEAFGQAVRESGLGGLVHHEQITWSEASRGLRGFEIQG